MLRLLFFTLSVHIGCTSVLLGQSSDQREFFETHIRPVLAEKCYHCHNSVDVDEAGLALDHREGIRSETEHGAVVVPGDPAASVLMRVLRHEIDDLEMPEDGGKLDDRVIGRFEEWIRMGAPDPRDEPPTKEQLAKATSWETTLTNRKQWWSLQPIKDTDPPATAGVDHAVDRFIRKQLHEHKLAPSPRADRRTLIRRLSYVLTGLPPSVDRIESFLDDDRPDAYERLVDDLLASERFGERWTRHWMDLMRYADSHGSEGDPAIPEIYRYRDYLIRAFNQDLPYDQLLREHIAGDLLDNPRINNELGINESLIGPAHWRLVFHGFAPTDALDEKVRFTDDQINVFSKAFLGLTVSCARCHDHKFDAISQADYYALFGILASCRPTLRDVNLPSIQTAHRDELTDLKQTIRNKVAIQWLDNLDATKHRLLGSTETWQAKIRDAKQPNQLFYVLSEFQRRTERGVKASEAWQQLSQAWQQHRENLRQDHQRKNAWHWDLTEQNAYDRWYTDGNGLPNSPTSPGEFRIESLNRVVSAILPSGVHANTLSTKHRAFMGSPRFKLDGEYKVWFHITGGGRSMTRYAVENYPRDGTVYPIRDINNERWFWHAFDLKYWQGDYVHLEINTARDAPLRTRNDERSWFGIREVIVREANVPAPVADDREFVEPLFASTSRPDSEADVVERYVDAIRSAIVGWRSDQVSDAQAILLNECLLEGLLDNTVEQLAQVASEVQQYLALEKDLRHPTRVPGLLEADVFDQPLFVRGNHRKPTHPIPRRFLEAIDDRPFRTEQSGRRELAEALLDSENPLTARVMVNRIWHYVFGRGIVPTPDNFGQLGERATHPDLLDYLATEFQRDWSIKHAIRRLVMSETFQQQSRATPEAVHSDPDNRWLAHAHVRRLDAESIRDTLLTVAGRMNLEMYGAAFAANSDVPRRAVYIRNRRNSLDQFLEAFNAPIPFATTGRRNQTNVPAQSLTMLNSPFVMQTAREWASRLNESDQQKTDQINALFEKAVGRLPNETEQGFLANYLQTMLEEAVEIRQRNALFQDEIEQTEAQLSKIITPVRNRLLEPNTDGKTTSGVGPVAAWDFQKGLGDTIGELHGTIHGKAEIASGALHVDGGYVSTPPIPFDVREKTLIATVQLENLQQQGGGVITIQTTDGVVFDSIVFGERQPGHWLAGSNNFARTEDFDGEVEAVADDEPVQIAIAYDDDGTIRGYRNGEPYGTSIRKSGLQDFERGKAHLLLGLRHGEGGSGRQLRGRILDGRLYNRALSTNEISSIATGQQFVSDKQVLAAMSASTREHVGQLRAKIEAMRAELQEPQSEQECWARLCHLLFNLKEFIYIR